MLTTPLDGPPAKATLQQFTFNVLLSAKQCVDTHITPATLNHSDDQKCVRAAIIRWNLLLLPVRRLQITVPFGRYHYWSLVVTPFFWQDVTWRLCVFQRLSGKLDEGLISSSVTAVLRLSHQIWTLWVNITRKRYWNLNAVVNQNNLLLPQVPEVCLVRIILVEKWGEIAAREASTESVNDFNMLSTR